MRPKSPTSKSTYEEIDPVPQRGRKQVLKYSLICVFTLFGIAIGFLVYEHIFNSSIPVSNNSDSDMGVLQSSANSAPESVQDIVLDLDERRSIRGKVMTSRAGKEYLAFLGIPYAKPPVGKLRFLPPVKIEPWIGTLNCTEFKADCIQKDKYNPNPVITTIGSEDCLYLNIFTPKKLETLKNLSGEDKKFPTMVYIHGGKQYGNANRYGMEYFMDEDVVVVSFHYRIGVLGNLNLNIAGARGNQGLKDQVILLQWVQENINLFGGDRDKVTLFGNSYGAIQASAHMLSPMSKGLFNRVICQSGTQIMPFILSKDPLADPLELGSKLNCKGTTPEELLQCFQNTEARDLCLNSYLLEFGTTKETFIGDDPDNVFLPDTPLNLLQSGNIHPNVSAIFGVVSSEGTMNSLPILNDPAKIEPFNEDWAAAAVPALLLDTTSPTLKDPDRIANAAKSYYLDNQNLSRELVHQFSNMFSDRRFYHPAHTYATFQNGRNKGVKSQENVYLYYFNIQAPKSYSTFLLDSWGDNFLGAGHADELQFLFPYNPFPTIPLDSKFARFSQMLVHLWVTFADKGKPSGANNGVESAEWLPISDEKPYRWFEISEDPKMIDFLGDRMRFWDSFDLSDLYV